MSTTMWLNAKTASCNQWSYLTLNGLMGRVWKNAHDTLWRYGVSKSTACVKELGNCRTRKKAMRMVEIEVGK